MSGGGSSSEEKSEKATPQKIKKARRDGHIGNSQEVGQWLGMMAATWLLPGVFNGLMDATSAAVAQIGSIIRTPDVGTAMLISQTAATDALKSFIPLAIVIAIVGVIGVGVQGGIFFSFKLLMPQGKKINPISGIKRMFGPQAAWQATKMLLKSSALGIVIYMSIKSLIPTLYGSGALPLSEIVRIAVSTAINVLRFAAITGLVLSIADFAVVKKRNNKQLKMTKYELKQEMKQSEGDPHMKGQRRSRAMAMSRNRMMQAVPTADVILVNPTHVAVALKYDPGRGAPRVVAKGADHVAARIRALADENRIPMVQDIPLARTLFATCDIGREIPEDLYKAVATVLAFIMALKSKGSAAGTHKVSTGTPMPAGISA
ncbi:MAG: EscU/YscU/HrcU family type III secretion system export apparatus switch protein [Nakamurella sp.]